MATFVLIHGSWHGGWCWYKTIPLLQRAGHTVIAPDLPGLGRDTTPIENISLESWTDCVCKLLDEQPERVLLVGHSRGGVVISSVAEKRPRKLAKLVYVAAGLLREGELLRELMAQEGTSLILAHRVMADDGLSTTVRPEAIKDIFYGDCSDEDVALAELLLRPEPVRPAATHLRLTPDNFHSVPRVYVECLRDRAIPLALQRRMHSALPCERVFQIDSDHSPFFSAPRRLAEILDTAAQ